MKPEDSLPMILAKANETLKEVTQTYSNDFHASFRYVPEPKASWAVVLAYNNVHLTKAAVASLQAQDIMGGVEVLVIDNCSKDSTSQWLDSRPDLHTMRLAEQDSVAGCWNRALRWLLIEKGEPYALVVNNDAVLRPDALRWLVADGGLFVTCVGKRDPECVKPTEMSGGSNGQFEDAYAAPDPAKKRPHPDYSCFLLRRECWDRVGPFDEAYKGAYCEDSEHHLAMHTAGIRAECLELPFYHLGAATVKQADPKERLRIQRQADKNRELFRRRHGFAVGSPEYYNAFQAAPPPSND